MSSLWRLRHYLRPYWRQVLIAFLALVGITAARLVIPNILRDVVDCGLTSGDRAYLGKAALLILGIGLGQAALTFVRRYTSEWLAQHIAYDLRNRLYDHIQHLDFAYHDQAQTGQLISRTTEDVRSLQRFAGYGLVELLQLGLLAAGAVALMVSAQPMLAGLALLPMIPLVWVTTRFGRKVSRLFYRVDQHLGELSTRVQENVIGAAVVRAFAREDYENARFDRSNRDLYDARVTVVSEWSRVMPTTQLLVTLSVIIILWFGGNAVLRGQMTLGEVVAFNGYIMLLGMPARQLAWLVNSGGEAAAGARRIFEVLDTPPKIQSPPSAVRINPMRGAVAFRNVWFRYATQTDDALRGIDLDVPAEAVVGILGPTGAGKSTLVNLIPRFYDPIEGAVLVDGHDVRSWDLATLRRQIGIVQQTPLLFSTTLRENIAYGRPDASEEEIIAVARAAQAHDFIMRLPEGYDTVVGERGITLSGGQRQRIALARALLMKPRILILDDATSSVDTETERLIQEALRAWLGGRTTFIIAQRITSIAHADIILVLQDGRIVQQGTHAELLAQPGLYRETYHLQAGDDSRA
ncbi:MAG TPA: ABC transporter ATP-binding protein [Chloroflexi bacterium]|nr:ABC transporter ATP-binding protein [Chloroflexota bacterium]